MRRVIVLVSVLAFVAAASTAQGQWVKAFGAGGGTAGNFAAQ